jgi:hypothetical protein
LSEVKTSQKGIDYVNPCTLKTKQRVYSQAMLMKIPHDHPNKSDISLKIGRYNLPFGKPVSDKPKSELTLDNDELNALVKYISEKYTPVNLGSGAYINVEGSNAALIYEFKKLVDGQADTANLLIENGILSDNVFIAATTIKKRNALSEFEEKLCNNLPESFWQN